MSKHTDSSNPLHDKAVKELTREIDPEKAEDRVSHWFGSAAQTDGGADNEDVRYYLAIIKFLKGVRRNS